MSSEETAFCISCGEEISSGENFCPECGASQDPEELNDITDSELDSHSGFTSWAVGFKPGSTLRNILVGITYVIFSGAGVALLIYGYLKENPEKLSAAAWISGIFFLLAGLAAFADGSGRGIIAGVISIIIGVVYLPVVRDKLPVGGPPGISDVNTGRRNVLVSTGYWFGGAVVVGSILPETESQTASSTGTTGGGSSEGGDGGAFADSSTPAPEPEPEFRVQVSYGGSWQGAMSVTGGGSSESRSISGSGTEYIDISGDIDIISVNAQKQDNSGQVITVQILHNGEVVSESSTSAEYGVAQTSQSFM